MCLDPNRIIDLPCLLPIFRQPFASAQQYEGALYHPASCNDDKACCFVWSLDNLKGWARFHIQQSAEQFVASITAICKEMGNC